jgi:mono/diheme cytochrome c family protein
MEEDSRNRHGAPVALVGFAVWLMTAGVAGQADRTAAAQLKNPIGATPASVDAGAKLYRQHCRSCHASDASGGVGDEGGPAPPNLKDDKWKYGSSDGEIFTAIKRGIPPDLAMPEWADKLTDAEIWHVVNYLRSLALIK